METVYIYPRSSPCNTTSQGNDKTVEDDQKDTNNKKYVTEQYLVERIFLECANAVFLFEIEMFKNTEVNLRNIYFWAGTAMCFKDS